VKLGAENKNKVIAAAVLGTIGVLAVAYELSGWFGSSSASTNVPAPTNVAVNVAPRQRNSAGNRNATSKKDPTQTLDPSLRFDVLKSSEDTKYEGTGRNIFRVFVETPPRPVVKVNTDQQAQQGPPPPAPYVPPPIELKFYGFATPAGGTKRIFLAHNEDVFIAKEGDIVDRRYKVMKISANSVDILDVLSNNRQSIPLTQG
jgi:hypothetical protein